MQLYEELTSKEKDMMEYCLDNKVRSVSKPETRASLDYIMRVWDEAKSKYLYELLGNQFIYETDIQIKEGRDVLLSKMRRLVDTHRFISDFYRALHVYEQEGGIVDDNIYRLLSAEFLANNKYEGQKAEFITPDQKKIALQPGCKPVKVLGKISKALNIDSFEDFRLDQSLVTNQRVIKGTLCLSIHPLDYMTMSDNASGWTSCMSWDEAGCYCRGTVEMMNSDCVVVAYLKDSKNYHIKGLDWNSKKWRQLFIVKPEYIFGIKAYPYKNNVLTSKIIDILSDLGKFNMGWEYTNPFPVEHEVKTETPEVPNSVFKFCLETDTMYNDCGCVDEHYVAVSTGFLDHSSDIIKSDVVYVDVSSDSKTIYCIRDNYSGPEECMHCGSTTTYFSDESELACEDCRKYYECSNCGDCLNEDEVYTLDGETMCEYCYDRYAQYCHLTDETHHEDNMVYLRVLPLQLIDLLEKAEDRDYESNLQDFPYGFYCYNDIIIDPESYSNILTDSFNSGSLAFHRINGVLVDGARIWRGIFVAAEDIRNESVISEMGYDSSEELVGKCYIDYSADIYKLKNELANQPSSK